MAKIAYILGHFPMLSETFVGEEMRAIEAAGHEVFPMALHRPREDFQPEDAALAKRTFYFSPLTPNASREAIKSYRLKLFRLLPFMLSQTTEPYYPFLAHAAHTANHIRRHDCTHIHAHFAWGAATYAIAAAKLLSLPVTFTCHGSDVYARPTDLALKCKSADAVFAVAPTLTEDVQKITGTPCHTLYCGVDAARFRPPEEASQKHRRWLFVGRLIDCKGVDDILAAWTRLPADARPALDIVGDGPLKETLVSYVRGHGLETHVTFLGAKPAAWIAEYGPRYRAFIAAFKKGSDGSKDTAPMVLKEAMAMALPIVTTDFIDIPGMVGRDCAIICPVSSPEALAEAVIRMEAKPQESLRKMGDAGRMRAKTYYSLTQQAKIMTELWSGL